MSADTNISWTDHTFNPWWGCQRVSPGCELYGGMQIVAADVFARAALPVEASEHLAAATGAERHRIALAGVAQRVDTVLSWAAAVFGMMLPVRDNLKICWAVVGFVAVEVMDKFAAFQRSAQHARSHHAVLVHIPANVGQRVVWNLEQYVPMLCNSAAAAPVRVICPLHEECGHDSV